MAKRLCWYGIPLLALVLAVAGFAQNPSPDSEPANHDQSAQPAQQPDQAQPAQPAQPSPAQPAPQDNGSSDVLQQMLEQVEQNPVIEPTQRPTDRQPADAGPRIDPRILGIAPGAARPTLRREGDFVVNRRGRMTRTADGQHVLFVFDADSREAPEAPMLLVPCQLLQEMERLAQQRGEQMAFVVSGQVLLYRGANYLLPTMMRPAGQGRNLQQ